MHFLFVSVPSRLNALCRPSPGSHCHTGVECRSSALIDLEAHDPVSKVKGHSWCDFCRYSNKQRPKGRKQQPRTQNNLGSDQRQLLNFFKLLYEDSKVSNESDSTSGGFQLRWNTDKAATSVHIGAQSSVAIAPRRRRR